MSRESHEASPEALRIGVSACLLGSEVRFNGGHKRHAFTCDKLGSIAELVSVCPEFELGLGVPRPTLRLVSEGGQVRLQEPRSGDDLTEDMQRFARERVRALADLDLDGFVLKKDSPSCGMERVKVYDGHGAPRRSGRGLFAAELMRTLPLLPVEEEGRLSDQRLREAFIERVFAFRRLKTMFSEPWAMSELVAFHSFEKLLVRAYDPAAAKELGRLVAQKLFLDRAELERRYMETYMRALSKPAKRGRQVAALLRLSGRFKTRLEATARLDIAACIEDFGAGMVPLEVPLRLLRHYAKVLGLRWLSGQSYLRAYPRPLRMRLAV